MVQFFSQGGELPFDLAGDVVTEDLDSMLASVSCGDDSLIKSLIENAQANEYVRGAALRALVALVVGGKLTRDSVIDYFTSLFREKLPRQPAHVWDCLVSCTMDLYPEELYEDIVKSFQEGLVDTFFVSPKTRPCGPGSGQGEGIGSIERISLLSVGGRHCQNDGRMGLLQI